MLSVPIGRRLAALILLLTCAAVHAAAQQQPIPVGLDAYRDWDRWDEQRIGMRAYMRSTYDRRGGNEGADASHFLYQLSDDFNVTLDLEGPGILMFSRFNHWHGSPWHFVVDGKDNLVEETSTADSLHPVPDSTFSPTIPDANQNVFTIGIGWHGKHNALEASYGLDFYNDRHINNDQVAAYNGTYTFNVHLISLAYRYSF